MKMVAAVHQKGSQSPSRFSSKDNLEKLPFFTVDLHNRWPLQGWSSGDEAHYLLDGDLVADECSRQFTLDSETRWPLQGWCNAHGPRRRTEDPRAPQLKNDGCKDGNFERLRVYKEGQLRR